MKFCKSLQRIASISDPSYAPYWTNYKLLKKLIKAMSTRDAASIGTSLSDPSMDYSGSFTTPQTSPQLRPVVTNSPSRTTAGRAAATGYLRETHSEESLFEIDSDMLGHANNDALRQNPREVAFFRLVRQEVKKATDFFDKVERECLIREQLVTVGMEILRKPQACMVADRWSVISRAIFFLYRDLLLLETFAIMTYVSFSKILKKHDKVTGYSTRDAFMVNIVHKASFTKYPKLMELIGRCQSLYQQASAELVQDLHEDERLFLNMVSEWNSRNRDVSGQVTTVGLQTDTVARVSHRPRNEPRHRPAPKRRAPTSDGGETSPKRQKPE